MDETFVSKAPTAKGSGCLGSCQRFFFFFNAARLVLLEPSTFFFLSHGILVPEVLVVAAEGLASVFLGCQGQPGPLQGFSKNLPNALHFKALFLLSTWSIVSPFA